MKDDEYYVCIGIPVDDKEPCSWNSLDADEEPYMRNGWLGGGARIKPKIAICPNCDGRAIGAPIDKHYSLGVDPDKFIKYHKRDK